ncbi:hypothetical protein [Halorhabdus salina]|uniref:hypothetical protein n=1 Tax=Halorhabdus salina TaxID=2750670 RepID=UPI0015EF0734|nr:hypothetical protein [Halorhabdus salina]
MRSPSALREKYRVVESWLNDHVFVSWFLLAVIPGGTYAGAQRLLNGGGYFDALVQGILFGVVVATFTLLFRQWRQQ